MTGARALKKTFTSPHRLPKAHSRGSVLVSELGCHVSTIPWQEGVLFMLPKLPALEWI